MHIRPNYSILFHLPGLTADLFFDIPTQQLTTTYTYTAVFVPIEIKYNIDFSGWFLWYVDVICDWMSHLATYLNQGWRLAGICLHYDQEQIYPDDGRRRRSRPPPLNSSNSVWFFEREVSKLQDQTPLYESTMVEIYAKAKVGFVVLKLTWTCCYCFRKWGVVDENLSAC